MSKKIRKLNNQGSTLVLVIVVSLFVAIIAALVLSLTFRNLENSKIRKDSADNFYNAENVLDEVRTTLEQYADQAAQAAYSAWLEEYSFKKNSDERRELFFRVYEETLRDLIQTEFVDKLNDSDSDNDTSFFTDRAVAEGCKVRWNTNEVTKFGLKDIKTDPVSGAAIYNGNVVLEGVSITYTDKKGLSTTITTNLDFDITYPGFKVFSASPEKPAYQYIIIADGDVYNQGAGDKLNLYGNIYAGGDNEDMDSINGIRFSGSGTKVNIFSDTIVTRNDFVVEDSAGVRIEGRRKEFNKDTLSYVSELWVNNILLTKSKKGSSGAQMLMNGRAYVADDLSLNADNTSFKLNGEYYGYSVSNAKSNDAMRNGTADGSSAIIINGKDAKLDLSAASTWVSGKAFISVPDSFGSTRIESFIEGESITHRGLQSAYLLPGECLEGVGHNPVSMEEYTRLLADENGNFNQDKLKTENFRAKTGIELDLYVDYDAPVRKIIVNYRQNGADHKMVYFYLNFRNHDKAQQYFEKYYVANKALSEKRMDMFGNGQILINADDDKLINTGNVIVYNEDGTSKKLEFIEGKNKYSHPDIVNKESELNTYYEAISTTLDKKNSGTSLASKATDSLVMFERIDTTEVKKQAFTMTDGSKYWLITGENVALQSSTYSGTDGALIIATNNVTVEAGIEFNGLIIAGNDVIMHGNTINLVCNPEKIAELISKHKEVSQYFVGEESFAGANDGSIYASDLITVNYDNWKKN